MFSQTAVDYAARDADAALRLYHALWPRLQADKALLEVYRTTMATMPLILAMERTGWHIDVGYLEGLIDEFQGEKQTLLGQIAEMGWPGLNPDSGDQVSAVLFDELGLEPAALTKVTKRPSTEDKHLQALLADHPIVPLVCDVREMTKLQAICRGVLKFQRGGVLLPRLNMCGTPQGRLSSRDPNLLAIPKRTKQGKRIRKAFLPPPGAELWSWDLSQADLRVLALGSREPALVELFNDPNGDPHADTAHRILGAPKGREHQDDSLHRLPAKAVNFGIPMGMGANGLVIQLHKERQFQWTEESCQRLLDDWHLKAYPTASLWLHRHIDQAEATGYTSCLGGRRLYVPGVQAHSQKIRKRARRQCMSFPMAGGTQHLMHLWEAAVYTHVVEPGLAQPILQIHDDLVLAGNPADYDLVDNLMRALLPQGFAVPIVADGKRGGNWGEIG